MPHFSPRSIADELRRTLDSLTTAERKLARVLLSNYPVAGLETVAQFAGRAEVSGPTVLRLISKLGYTSYLDFQQALRDELKERLQSPMLTPKQTLADSTDPLTRMGEVITENIRYTLGDLPRDTFDAVVTLLADPRRSVYLLGGRFGYSLAVSLHARLHMLRKNVFLVSAQTSTWPETILDLGNRDVLVVFDARRYQANVQDFAEQAAARGTQIVLFTDQWLSPIANVATHTLIMKVNMPTRWDTAVPTLTVLECLIAVITDLHWDNARSRLEQLELMRQPASGASGANLP
jgi:DNA-binding MurR/RpiR family transcriptional regulator